METLRSAAELRAYCDARRLAGETIAFVPTMGFLHEGHLSLMRLGRQRADRLIVSIFVNPTQFAPSEDLDRYPRDAEGDAAKCRREGASVIFAPPVEELYPSGAQSFVEVEGVSQGLCGARRPTHFRGVATVVAKLFNIVGPCVAVFGTKDYQQLQVVRRMVDDLCFAVEIVAGPLVRESDGLAMSSRNAYLSPAQRRAASCLHGALRSVEARLREGGALTAREALRLAREHLAPAVADQALEASVDYVELRRQRSLAALQDEEVLVPGEAVMLLAVHFGATRLIDNLEL